MAIQNDRKLVAHIVAIQKEIEDPANQMKSELVALLDTLAADFAPSSEIHMKRVREDFAADAGAGNDPDYVTTYEEVVRTMEARIVALEWMVANPAP